MSNEPAFVRAFKFWHIPLVVALAALETLALRNIHTLPMLVWYGVLGLICFMGMLGWVVLFSLVSTTNREMRNTSKITLAVHNYVLKLRNFLLEHPAGQDSDIRRAIIPMPAELRLMYFHPTIIKDLREYRDTAYGQDPQVVPMVAEEEAEYGVRKDD